LTRLRARLDRLPGGVEASALLFRAARDAGWFVAWPDLTAFPIALFLFAILQQLADQVSAAL